MNWVAPQPPGTSHRLEECDCGKPALTDWLLNQARQAQGSGSARTFVACDQDRVAGYYSLTVGQIDTGEAPERIRRGMGQYPIPLVILTRLAVGPSHRCRGRCVLSALWFRSNAPTRAATDYVAQGRPAISADMKL